MCEWEIERLVRSNLVKFGKLICADSLLHWNFFMMHLFFEFFECFLYFCEFKSSFVIVSAWFYLQLISYECSK